jgi:hypothetical protein
MTTSWKPVGPEVGFEHTLDSALDCRVGGHQIDSLTRFIKYQAGVGPTRWLVAGSGGELVGSSFHVAANRHR